MNDKQNEIKKYLEGKDGKGTWSPLNLLESKFNITRSELSKTFAEMLGEMDVRIERDIVHVSIF